MVFVRLSEDEFLDVLMRVRAIPEFMDGGQPELAYQQALELQVLIEHLYRKKFGQRELA